MACYCFCLSLKLPNHLHIKTLFIAMRSVPHVLLLAASMYELLMDMSEQLSCLKLFIPLMWVWLGCGYVNKFSILGVLGHSLIRGVMTKLLIITN